jgi:SAM-dependent methyltransferase
MTGMQLLRMMDGLIVHQALHAAAKLGVADLLKDNERSAKQLARELKVKEDALQRLLRFLAGQGVFFEAAPGVFRNSELSHFMRSDVPGSVRATLIFRGSPYFFAPFTEFVYSIETGQSAREKIFGMEGFEYLRQHPEQARIFDDAMTVMSSLTAPAIANAYDFGVWGTVMDVGGGNGVLLAEILRAFPALGGVLADQEHVLQRAKERGFLAGQLSHRVRFEPCNFFEHVPEGCHAYLMKNVIHDWDDEASRTILRNCHRVVPSNGVLLLVEWSLGEINMPSFGKVVDLVMLAVTGGKERTPEEYRLLLEESGFRLNRIVPAGEMLILEAMSA